MGLFAKLFGSKSEDKGAKTLAEEVLSGTIEKAGLSLSFDVDSQQEEEKTFLNIEIYGDDEESLREKDGALLDAFQLFIKRAVQHHFPKEFISISVDSNGYREKANEGLVNLAEKLKNKALEQGKSVYLRALPPKDRKVIHQFLAEDERVKSRSVGDGLYKKIKIYPVRGGDPSQDSANDQIR